MTTTLIKCSCCGALVKENEYTYFRGMVTCFTCVNKAIELEKESD